MWTSELTECYFRQMFVPCILLKFLLKSRCQKLWSGYISAGPQSFWALLNASTLNVFLCDGWKENSTFPSKSAQGLGVCIALLPEQHWGIICTCCCLLSRALGRASLATAVVAVQVVVHIRKSRFGVSAGTAGVWHSARNKQTKRYLPSPLPCCFMRTTSVR